MAWDVAGTGEARAQNGYDKSVETTVDCGKLCDKRCREVVDDGEKDLDA
jgi:hypothetical protein